MRELRTQIEIDAPPERLWQVLTDFGAYPNGTLTPARSSASRESAHGLKVHIQPPGARAMTFRPTVRAAEPARELRWLGRLFLPGLVDGEHRLALDPLEGGRSRFIQGEASAGARPPAYGNAHRDRARIRADERQQPHRTVTP